MREDRFRTIVMGVMEEAVRRAGARGVVLGGRGPEGTLLESWFAGSVIPVTTPPPEVLEAARELILRSISSHEATSIPGLDGWNLAARVLAAREGLLLLGTATKTTVLLSPGRQLEPVLPLADLYASEILELRGECSVPPCLEGADEGIVRAVDLGLQEYLEGNLEPRDALPGVQEPFRFQVLEALQGVREGWMPTPLVPNFRPFTLGIDLDL